MSPTSTDQFWVKIYVYASILTGVLCLLNRRNEHMCFWRCCSVREIIGGSWVGSLSFIVVSKGAPVEDMKLWHKTNWSQLVSHWQTSYRQCLLYDLYFYKLPPLLIFLLSSKLLYTPLSFLFSCPDVDVLWQHPIGCEFCVTGRNHMTPPIRYPDLSFCNCVCIHPLTKYSGYVWSPRREALANAFQNIRPSYFINTTN